MMVQRPWRIRIDTGGTFTDCVAVDPEGHPRRAKVLSHGALRGGVVSANGPRLRLELSESLPRGFLIGWVLSDLEGGRVHRIDQTMKTSGSHPGIECRIETVEVVGRRKDPDAFEVGESVHFSEEVTDPSGSAPHRNGEIFEDHQNRA